MQGGDCFGAFMQWGLPKGTLKDVWAAVAGDQGYLSQQQFVQCLYLMDNAKRVSLTAFPAAGLLVESFACGTPHNNDQPISQSVSQETTSLFFAVLGLIRHEELVDNTASKSVVVMMRWKVLGTCSTFSIPAKSGLQCYPSETHQAMLICQASCLVKHRLSCADLSSQLFGKAQT